jgi:methanogenic corrinoid protein MtbC1
VVNVNRDGLFSPRQAARAIGVSESSIKRWCDLGRLETVRTAGGHRKITLGELVHFAQESGLRFDAANLALPTSSSRSGSDNAVLLADLLLSGDRDTARSLVLDLFFGGMKVHALCDMIADSFTVIGDRWSCRQADVYQERRGCEIVLDLLHEMRRYLRPPVAGLLAIGGTLSDDHYMLPSAMADLVLRAARFQTQNLGTSLPIAAIVQAVRDTQPQLLWLSASHILDEDEFVRGIDALWTECVERNVGLIVGGRALTEAIRRRLQYTTACDTMQHLASFATSLTRLKSVSAAPALPTRGREPAKRRRRSSS